MRTVIVFLALIATAALAGTVITNRTETWSLRDGEGHPINLGGFKTYAACEEAALKLPARYRCIGTVAIEVAGVCDDVPAPAPIVNAEGFTDVGDLEGHICPDGLSYYFTQTQPVRDNALYPKCWEARPVKITECTGLVNPWWEPDPNAYTPPLDPGALGAGP